MVVMGPGGYSHHTIPREFEKLEHFSRMEGHACRARRGRIQGEYLQAIGPDKQVPPIVSSFG